MSRVSIDCDGVLANFTRGFIDAANTLWPGKVPPEWEPHQWDYTEVLTPKEVGAVFEEIRATENWWLRLLPYSENVCSLARWFVSQRDRDVWIVTSRARTAGMTVAKQTHVWLHNCGIRPLNNYMAVVASDDSDMKATIYEAMAIEWSIDDKAETVEQCDQLRHHRAYLLDRPWNQDAKVKRRVHTLEEFLREIR